MRRFALTAAVILLPAMPVAAQTSNLRIESNNALNITEVEQFQPTNRLELRQTGNRNIARVRQRGTVNTSDVIQTGPENSASVWQSGDANSVSVQQYDTVTAALSGQSGRMNRALVVNGSDTSYLTAYQNGPVNILQITQNPQPYGRLGRR